MTTMSLDIQGYENKTFLFMKTTSRAMQWPKLNLTLAI